MLRLCARRAFASRPCKRYIHYILGLESSADDTCAAVLKSCSSRVNILSNIVIKQPIHETYGGIYPALGARLHTEHFPRAIRCALQEACIQLADLSAIAYTRGPGLANCLSVCSVLGRTMAASLNIPCVGVHHMQAHALTQFLTEEQPAQFPYLTLLVSGGHTLLLLARSSNSFDIIANTLDSSIGDAFDKISRALEIPWTKDGPGAALERLASTNTLPLIKFASKNVPHQLAFSFSGLRSATERCIARLKTAGAFDDKSRAHIAASFQVEAINAIEEKIEMALKTKLAGTRLESLVCSGGVASNEELRNKLQMMLKRSGIGMRLIFPPARLCTDNAAMIAYVGLDRLKRANVDINYTLPFHPKWSIEECERMP